MYNMRLDILKSVVGSRRTAVQSANQIADNGKERAMRILFFFQLPRISRDLGERRLGFG